LEEEQDGFDECIAEAAAVAKLVIESSGGSGGKKEKKNSLTGVENDGKGLKNLLPSAADGTVDLSVSKRNSIKERPDGLNGSPLAELLRNGDVTDDDLDDHGLGEGEDKEDGEEEDEGEMLVTLKQDILEAPTFNGESSTYDCCETVVNMLEYFADQVSYGFIISTYLFFINY